MYQVIPRHYGLVVGDTIFPPSYFALAIIGLVPKKEIKEKIDLDYSELEKLVKKEHGSYNLLRKEAFKKGNCKSTEINAEIKSRNDGRRGDINNYRKVYIRHPFLEDILDNGIEIRCQCEDNVYGKYGFSVCCYHASATLLELDAESKYGWGKIKFSGKLGTPFIPYEFDKEMIRDILLMKYFEGKKYFEFDITHPKLKKEIEELVKKGYFTMEVLPHEERGINELKEIEEMLRMYKYKKAGYTLEKFSNGIEIGVRFISETGPELRLISGRENPTFIIQGDYENLSKLGYKVYSGKDYLDLNKRDFIFVRLKDIEYILDSY